MTVDGDVGSRALRGAAFATLVSASAAAAAAPWVWEPSVTLLGAYQSNPQYYTDAARAGSGALLTASLPVSWDDGHSRFSFSPSLNAGVSTGAEALGTHDRSVAFKWTNAEPRSSWRASADAARQDLFGVVNGDLGVLRPTGSWTVSDEAAGTTYRASERTTLDADASRSRVHYSVAAGPYVDYDYQVLTGQLGFKVTERAQVRAILKSSRYSPDAALPSNSDREYQLGASYNLTETLSLSAVAGRSTTRQTGRSQDSVGTVFQVLMTQSLATGSATLALSQGVQPGSFGDLTHTTDYSISGSHALSERFRLGAAAGISRYRDTFQIYSLSDRAYRHAELNLSYALTPTWRLEARANLQRAEYGASVFAPTALAATTRGVSVQLTKSFAGRTFDGRIVGG